MLTEAANEFEDLTEDLAANAFNTEVVLASQAPLPLLQ